ncbi:MFS transporter [Amycolatopsis sp. DG1A-15b]|nr:MFS transporter [Amycolatopsis sp. DG1A-15b]WIX93436.1 MFS transporter [Amycolatopsis sp. DG1A-15b]
MIAAAQLLIVMDGTIVTVGLPAIATGLDIAETDLNRVLTAYAPAFGGLLLAGGRAGDLFGRRRVFRAGLVAFLLAAATHQGAGCARRDRHRPRLRRGRPLAAGTHLRPEHPGGRPDRLRRGHGLVQPAHPGPEPTGRPAGTGDPGERRGHRHRRAAGTIIAALLLLRPHPSRPANPDSPANRSPEPVTSTTRHPSEQ